VSRMVLLIILTNAHTKNENGQRIEVMILHPPAVFNSK